MKTRFVILAGPRTGSTAVRLWLNSHPAIRCHDEVLLKASMVPDAIRQFVTAGDYPCEYNGKTLEFPNDPCTSRLLRDFLEHLYSHPDHAAPWTSWQTRKAPRINDKFEREQAVGFKFMYYLLENRYLSEWIDGGAVRIIHLVRENVLKQFVSYLAAKQRNVHHSDTPVEAIRVHVDTGAIAQTLGELEQRRLLLELRFRGTNCLRITYEQFCEAPTKLGSRVIEFLGVDNAAMIAPPLAKLNSDDLSVLIENYDDVVHRLRGTPFIRHLADETCGNH